MINSKYTRFPFLPLMYRMKHIAVEDEILISFSHKAVYLKKESSDILLSGNNEGVVRSHISNINNPHKLDKEDILLSRVENINHVSNKDFNIHKNKRDNPHGILKDDIELDNLKNYPPATIEDIMNNDDESYVTTDLLYQLLDDIRERTYTVIFNTNPTDATVRVSKNPDLSVRTFNTEEWFEGNTHELTKGEYIYEVSKIGYGTERGSIYVEDDMTVNIDLTIKKYVLTVNTYPEDAEIKIKYNNVEMSGHIVEVPNGVYTIECSKPGYTTAIQEVTVLDSDLTISMTLIEEIYTVTFSVLPDDAIIKLNNIQITNNIKTLKYGEYKYEISKPGYHTITETILVSSDLDITHNLKQILHSLNIETTPTSATARVKVNNSWEYGKSHNLPNGSYEVECYLDGYETQIKNITILDNPEDIQFLLSKTQYTLIINTIPADAIINVKIGERYMEGNTHSIPNGTYEVKVDLNGYISKTLYVDILDSDKEINITLEEIKYALSIDTAPIDAVVEVYYNNTWNVGKSHMLPNGSYNIRAKFEGYDVYEQSVDISNSNKNISIILNETLYNINISCTPIHAIVEVFIDDKWVAGNHFKLPNGSYEVRCIAEGHIEMADVITVLNEDIYVNYDLIPNQYTVTINTIPTDALVEIEIEPGVWVAGNKHTLDYGYYNIRCSLEGYTTIEQSVMFDSDKTEEYVLNPSEYLLFIVTDPVNASVRVLIDDTWVDGKNHSVLSGTYQVEVISNGYITKTQYVDVLDSDITVTIHLDEIKYNLTINTNPEDALVEVYYNDTWNVGNMHELPMGEYDIKAYKEYYYTNISTILIDADYAHNITLEGISIPEDLNDDSKKIDIEISTIPTDADVMISSVDSTSSPPGSSYSLIINTIPDNAEVSIIGPDEYISHNKTNTGLNNGEYNITVSANKYYTHNYSVILDKDIDDTITLENIYEPLDLNDDTKKIRVSLDSMPTGSSIKLKS